MRGVKGYGFLVMVLLVGLASAVDRSTFKNCTQSDFCSRLRTKTPESSYAVDLKSVTFKNTTLSMVLNHKTNKVALNLTISVVEGGIFRLTIHEVNSTRYRLQGVLEKDPKLVSAILNQSNNITTLTRGDYKVMAHANTLKIEFYYKNKLVSVINEKSKFVYEKETGKQAVAFDVRFVGASRVYGIPEHGDKLALRTTKPGASDPYRLYNLDVAFHELESPMALYGAVPVVYGHSENHTSGVFFHNAAEQWIEITHSPKGDGVEAYFMAESGIVDLFFMLGPKPKDTVKQYSTLTGVAPLPQLWTLGYHQCRWNYDNSSDVKYVIAQLDRHNFPVDVIWLDIEYTDGKRYFTWDPVHFKNPKEMLANLSSTNRKLVAIIDPHIKVDPKYVVYKGLKDQGYFVKNPNRSDFEGDCWPGRSSYVDFFNPKAADYYASWYAYNKFNGTDATLAGIWNDMNEPSVFDDSLEKTFPKNLIHHGGVVHRDVHNIYGLQQTKATYKGLIDRDSGKKRPFILTRAHFAGTQRYSAVWTGDNTASWDFLKAGYQMCLSESLSGISFCGADVGGFFNNPSEELLQRWYQAGIWLPFFRAHANKETKRREPYLFSTTVQSRIRAAIKQRYAHIPTWYTLFYEHYRTSEPIVRPVFYGYPSDPKVIDIDDQLLVGENILVKAVSQPSVKSVPVYFPGGQDTIWYDLQKNLSYPGLGQVNINVTLDAIPVYYKSGSIVVRKDTSRRNTHEMRADKYHLYIQLNKKGEANGTVYIDDTESFDYRNKKYTYLALSYKNNAFGVSPIDKDASYPQANFTVDYMVISRPPKSYDNDLTDGEPVVFEQEKISATADGVQLEDITFDLAEDNLIYL